VQKAEQYGCRFCIGANPGYFLEVIVMNKAWVIISFLTVGLTVNAGTVAYWQFEEGPADAQISHGGQGDGVYYQGTADSSGNGFGLSVWAENWAGYAYKTDVAAPVFGGHANNFSAKNSGGNPAMFTNTASGINTIQPAAFTIEATFKLENGGYRTIVGRDSQGAYANDQALSALYFQAMPDNVLAIKFCDVAGYWHEAVSAANVISTFDYPSNPDGVGVPWYSMAGVSDGKTLSLYLRNATAQGEWQLLAQTDMTLSGSIDTALTKGTGDGGDWNAGDWSVGRGLWNGWHVDRAYGFIDEVRISDSALTVGEFLVPEPMTLTLLAFGGLLLRKKR
jgi:hypothetical protein